MYVQMAFNGVLVLCNRVVSEKILQYVIVFSERTDVPEVRCDLTDTQTDQTTTVSLLHMSAEG